MAPKAGLSPIGRRRASGVGLGMLDLEHHAPQRRCRPDGQPPSRRTQPPPSSTCARGGADRARATRVGGTAERRCASRRCCARRSGNHLRHPREAAGTLGTRGRRRARREGRARRRAAARRTSPLVETACAAASRRAPRPDRERPCARGSFCSATTSSGWALTTSSTTGRECRTASRGRSRRACTGADCCLRHGIRIGSATEIGDRRERGAIGLQVPEPALISEMVARVRRMPRPGYATPRQRSGASGAG